MKIILAELDKHLLPEYYPYFEKHFYQEKFFLKKYNGNDEIAFKNIAFKLKVMKLSYSIINDEVRMKAQYLFEKLIDDYFNWQKGYDWKDL